LVGDENAALGRGGGVGGPGDGASEEVEDVGDGMERTSATGLSLKRARRRSLLLLLAIMVGCMWRGGGCANKSREMRELYTGGGGKGRRKER
jgi:hypothetical protein